MDGLYDSLITTTDSDIGIKLIKISSKDKKGNTPSIKSIIEYLNSETNDVAEQKYKNNLIDTYDEPYEILTIIYNNSMYTGPLKLFMYLLEHTFEQNTENQQFLNYIKSYFSINNDNDFNKLLNNLKSYINYKLSVVSEIKCKYDQTLLNAFSLVKDQKLKLEKCNEDYNVLSGIAKCCVNYVNSIYKDQFTKLFKAVLSSQNFIQIHFYLNESQNKNNMVKIIPTNIKFVEKVVNDDFTGDIILTAEKNYFSTQIKGKICFIVK